ncbi:MAG: response regulator [Acidobacteriota bacterium]|jgi:CheY-like chemotaxis protein
MTGANDNHETILVVEDEQVVLDLVTSILKDKGFTVLCARSGEEAVQIGSRHEGRIDLVLTDIVMPGMSGGELVRRLSPLKPEIRVLYMSGYTKYTVAGHGVLESVDSFIWKPFSPGTLLQKVREVLNSPPGIA